ncbi:uncharacterized protein [Nicotiana sylvestris]
MTGLRTSTVADKLHTNPMCPPVKEKLRKFKTNMSLKIKEEVIKQIKAKVLRVFEYPTWLANIMPFPKKDGKVRSLHSTIFKMQMKDAATSWTEECQKAFNKIQEYLTKQPVLVPPKPGKPLLLYLSTLDGAFGYVLGQHDETIRKEHAIYYMSKKFTPYEARYSLLECTCNVLTWIAQKLRHYICAYTTYLISWMDPLKYIFQKPMPTGEDITEAYDSWRMFFDGAENFKGVGIRVVLVSETGQYYLVFAKLRFPCTNDMAEYEACIFRIKLAIDINVQELLVIGDSDLLVHQIYADMTGVSPNELNATSSMWPFSAWDMDVIGLIEPTASNGVPESIITDNAANLNSDPMKAMCETFKIRHKNSTSYRPQMNGVVEAANKNIKKILRKTVDNYKQWQEKLPFAFLGYYITVLTSTGATHYLLVYGTEVVIPAEVEIHSLRIIQEAELSNAEWVQSCYEQLALIYRKKMNVICHDQLYQNRMARAFNKKVRLKQFTQGQLVLKRIFPYQDQAKGKFSPNWQGPYLFHRVLTGGTLILVEMDKEI